MATAAIVCPGCESSYLNYHWIGLSAGLYFQYYTAIRLSGLTSSDRLFRHASGSDGRLYCVLIMLPIGPSCGIRIDHGRNNART